MDTSSIDEFWYRRLANKYGHEAAIAAGYFQETKPWTQTYTEVFGLDYFLAPAGTLNVLQFSGAFFPFHEGHRDAIQAAIAYLVSPVFVVIHVDHKEYRHSKGHFDEELFEKSFELAETLNSNSSVQFRIVFEDRMPDGCSRNFTRLYQEIVTANPSCKVWFLAGGDRASFSQTFVDAGRCLIVGRDSEFSDPTILKQQNERIVFLPGRNSSSSTNIRNRND